jgi:hypothetical protein
MARELSVTKIFEPVDANVGIACHDVGHAVIRQIDGRDRVEVAETIGKKVCGEADEMLRGCLPESGRKTVSARA